MHGMIMVIYLLTALFLGGFGNYLIPLMVGARDMVFPYVNMVSYWVYLFAVLFAGRELLRDRRAHGRRLDPVSAPGDLPGHARGELGNHPDARFLAFFIVGFTMGGLNYVVTVLQARARGMTMMRLPLTVWGILMATVWRFWPFPPCSSAPS